MAEFAVRVSRGVGCLDRVVSALGDAGVQIDAVTCACQQEGTATFSLADRDSKAGILREVEAKETGAEVLHIKVANEVGCLSRVTSSLSKAGVTIGSLACACAAGDESGIVAVSLQARE